MAGNDEMITIEQAEEEFGMKRATIYKYAKRGDITTYRRPGDRKSYVQRAAMRRLREFRPRYSVEQPDPLDQNPGQVS